MVATNHCVTSSQNAASSCRLPQLYVGVQKVARLVEKALLCVACGRHVQNDSAQVRVMRIILDRRVYTQIERDHLSIYLSIYLSIFKHLYRSRHVCVP